MKHYYITGTSRGIGKAIAEHILAEKSGFVTGISRSCTISNPAYKHIYADLSKPEDIKDSIFENHSDCEEIVLFNNSGSLGNILYCGKNESEDIVSTFNLNLISPAILMNAFVKAYRNTECIKTIVNISSGAAQNPYDGWSTYCSSKAGLDMYSRVVDLEQKIDNSFPIRVFAIAPGVVGTQMQEQIRTAGEHDFSKLEQFIGYHESGMLASPEQVAVKIFRILAVRETIPSVVISVRDF